MSNIAEFSNAFLENVMQRRRAKTAGLTKFRCSADLEFIDDRPLEERCQCPTSGNEPAYHAISVWRHFCTVRAHSIDT